MRGCLSRRSVQDAAGCQNTNRRAPPELVVRGRSARLRSEYGREEARHVGGRRGLAPLAAVVLADRHRVRPQKLVHGCAKDDDVWQLWHQQQLSKNAASKHAVAGISGKFPSRGLTPNFRLPREMLSACPRPRTINLVCYFPVSNANDVALDPLSLRLLGAYITNIRGGGERNYVTEQTNFCIIPKDKQRRDAKRSTSQQQHLPRGAARLAVLHERRAPARRGRLRTAARARGGACDAAPRLRGWRRQARWRVCGVAGSLLMRCPVARCTSSWRAARCTWPARPA